MADALVDRVDNGLSVGPDLVDVGVEVEYPVQRLLWRGDVVSLGAEHQYRRFDITQINGLAVRHLDTAGSQIVADEELIDNELDFLRIQVDVPAPPALEFEVAVGFGVDLREYVVLLAPERVGGILALEILHQPGAVELSATDISD